MNTHLNYAFLICSERGGSNLILRMLDSHPAYIGPGATHLIRIFLRNASRYGDLKRDEEWSRFVHHVVDVFQSNELHWETTVEAEVLEKNAAERSLAGVIDCIYGAEAAWHGKAGVFIKEIAAYDYIPYFTTHFPGCRFVYMVRDPRDVALSWKNRDWWWTCGGAAGVRHAAKVWKQNQEMAMQRYYELRDTGSIILLRYEDLLLRPELSLGRVCQCLGIPYSDEMLDFYRSDRARSDSRKRTVFKNLSKPLLRNNSGKFIDGLTREETQWVEHWCCREMRLLGYEPYYTAVADFEKLDAVVAAQEAERLKNNPVQDAPKETEQSKARVEMLQGISAQEEISPLFPEGIPTDYYTNGK